METKVRRFFCSFLVLLAFSCGTLRPTPAAYLVEKVWEFSQSRPEGFTLELSTWTEPKEGISAAYELAESCVDISGLELVINHAQAHEGFVGGWLNSADSHALGLKQTLGWDGKIISAHAGITYNQTWRIAKTDGAIKKSFDWRLTGDISARLGKGWSIGVDTRYRSKVATFFTIFKEYCELNAHVQKDFKRFTLFFDAKDLLDQPRETSFESDELKEYWIEEVRSNRRLFILGARWKF